MWWMLDAYSVADKMCIRVLSHASKVPLYTSLQACMRFSKVHNSYSINNNPKSYKFLTSILLVQISYSKRTNMAFHSHLSAINNLGTLNHSMVFSSHFQASNNLGTLNHSTVLRTHLQASNNLGTLKHSTVLRIHLQASNNLGTLKHSTVLRIHLQASSNQGTNMMFRSHFQTGNN